MTESKINEITQDESLKEFRDENFNAKDFATKVIKSQAITQQLALLSQGIHKLDRELNTQVSEHYEDLLSQATGIQTLEGVLQIIQSRTQSLLNAFDRIKIKIEEPYEKISTMTSQMKRIQETCDALRQIIRVSYLSKRLKVQLDGGVMEMTKASQSLNELEYLSNHGMDLSEIEVIEDEKKLMRRGRVDMETGAQSLLQEGVQSQNQSQVGTALQIFFNLNLLQLKVDELLNSSINQVFSITNRSLDINHIISVNDKKGGAPGRASGLSMGNTAVFRVTLWNNLEKLTDHIYSSFNEILTLEKVLGRKRDPVSQVLLKDYLKDKKGENYKELIKEFWTQFTQIIKKEFYNVSENNSFIKQALDSEYPKLLRLFKDLVARIRSLAGPGDFQNLKIHFNKSDSGFHKDLISTEQEVELFSSFQQFESAYLSRSLSLLFDPINIIFSTSSSSSFSLSTLPSDNDFESIIKTMTNELNITSFDGNLNQMTSKSISKTLLFVQSKLEQMMIGGTEVNQVVAPPTEAQIYNANVVNLLYKFSQMTEKAFSNLTNISNSIINQLNESLKSNLELVEARVDAILQNFNRYCEDVLYSIHEEDFSETSSSSSSSSSSSLYMEELRQFILRFSTNHLSLFHLGSLLIPRLNLISKRCLVLFIRHVSLLYPLAEEKREKILKDFVVIETAITPLTKNLTDLGKTYKMLRAAKPLITQLPETFLSTSSDLLPISTLTHFLFSRGYPDLKPPYQTAGWSPIRYSKWLDIHQSEKERLDFIKGSLESYAKKVQEKGEKQFAGVYPVLVEMVKKGVEEEEK